MSHFFSFQNLLFLFQHIDYAGFGCGSLCLSRIGLNFLNWSSLNFWMCGLMLLLIKFWKSSDIFFFNFFLLLSLSSLLVFSVHTCWYIYGVLHFSEVMYIFLNYFFSVFFTLYDLYWSTFKLIDSFFSCSNLLLHPWCEFFISVIRLLNSRISLFKNVFSLLIFS